MSEDATISVEIVTNEILVELVDQQPVVVEVSGPAGPTAVSKDAGNTSTLGTDGLLYTNDRPYVNARTPQITVSDTEPVNPAIGDVWIDAS